MANPRIDKARIAEWLLARVSTERRAAEIVGDLLETPYSPFVFWTSVTGIFFALGKRSLLAPLLAVFSFAIPVVAFGLSQNAWHHVPHHFDPWMHVSAVLMMTSMFIWTVPALALVRFGRRDPVTLISLLLATLVTLSSSFAWFPLAFYCLVAAFPVSIFTLSLHRTSRRALLCIAGAVPTVALLAWATSQLALSFDTVRQHDDTLSGFLIWTASICVEAWVLNYLHTRLLPHSASPATSIPSSTI